MHISKNCNLTFMNFKHLHSNKRFKTAWTICLKFGKQNRINHSTIFPLRKLLNSYFLFNSFLKKTFAVDSKILAENET